jgi:hypothetical protein
MVSCLEYVLLRLHVTLLSTEHTHSSYCLEIRQDNLRDPRNDFTGSLCVSQPPDPALRILIHIVAEYVIVMTGREHRARFMGHDIYRAADFDILPLNPNVSVQNPPNPVEGHLLALVRSHLLGGHFLFSYGWDLSRRLQAQWQDRDNEEKKALWEVVSADICI